MTTDQILLPLLGISFVKLVREASFVRTHSKLAFEFCAMNANGRFFFTWKNIGESRGYWRESERCLADGLSIRSGESFCVSSFCVKSVTGWRISLHIYDKEPKTRLNGIIPSFEWWKLANTVSDRKTNSIFGFYAFVLVDFDMRLGMLSLVV